MIARTACILLLLFDEKKGAEMKPIFAENRRAGIAHTASVRRTQQPQLILYITQIQNEPKIKKFIK